MEMKICLIDSSDIPRSIVWDLGYYLNKNGHEVTILYPTRNRILKARGGVRSISFPAFFLPKIHYVIPNLLKEYQILYKLVKREKYDIIQACDYDYLTSLPPIFIKRKMNVPIVITTDAFPGVSWFFGNYFVDFVAKLYTKSLGKFILHSYDKLIIYYNKSIEDALRLGVPKCNIHIIPSGIDFNAFSDYIDVSKVKDNLGIKDNEKVLLFVGRLSLVKRIDILIELTKRLLNDGFNIKTIIVGEGEYKLQYKKLAESVNNNVIFIGEVPHTDISKYYAIADVFVLPSLSEGLPRVLLEAAACCKPMVASKTGGVPDIIIHGKTGFLAEPNNVNSFVHYVKLLLNDEDLSRKFGRNAYMHVKKKFDWNAITKKIESIYEEVAEVKRIDCVNEK